MCGRASRRRSPIDTYPGRDLEGEVDEHQPGHRRRVLAAAGAERDRQLGQGRAAHSGAARDRAAAGRSAAARRHERRGRDRHRPSPPAAGFVTRALAWLRAGRAGGSVHGPVRPPAATAPHRGADHRLDHAGDDHAGARHHDRQRRAAAHAGQPVGDPGPDHLGADLLHRRRGDHDAADRLARRPVRPQAAVPGARSSASPSPRCCAAPPHRWTQIVLFRLLQGVFGAALVPLSQAVLLDINPARAARPGDGDLGRGRHGRADPRADARRLADRELQLALGVLHQPAGRHPRLPRRHGLRRPRRRSATARASTSSASPCSAWRSARCS